MSSQDQSGATSSAPAASQPSVGAEASETPPQTRAARLLQDVASGSLSINPDALELPPLSPEPVRRQLFPSSSSREKTPTPSERASASEHKQVGSSDQNESGSPDQLQSAVCSAPPQTALKTPQSSSSSSRSVQKTPPKTPPQKHRDTFANPVTPQDATPQKFKSRAQPQSWERTKIAYAKQHGLEYRDKDGTLSVVSRVV